LKRNSAQSKQGGAGLRFSGGEAQTNCPPSFQIDIVVQHFPRDAENANTGGNILLP
jgi:hypothetical protein